MKAKAILQWSLLLASALALVLIAMPVPAAFASDPPPSLPPGLPWGLATPWPTAAPLTIGKPWSVDSMNSQGVSQVNLPAPSIPLPMATPVARVNGGASPLDALEPTDVWQQLDAGGSVWYRVGSGGVHMEVWLESVPHSGVDLDIFAPNQLHYPIGRGTASSRDSARLLWAGGHWKAQGDWYALVTNHNPMAIRYRIGRVQSGIGNKSCYSYWEYIGPNLVYWTDCR